MLRGHGDLVTKLFRRDELTDRTGTELAQNPTVDNKMTAEGAVEPSPHADSQQEHVQRGIKQAEAVTAVWTKKALVIAYAGIFLVFYVNSLQQQVTGSLSPYVTSAFSEHSLVATTTVLSSIIGAVAKLPIAKIIDIWGRAEGYSLMVFLCTIGLIMMAACNNVETYAAAQVFYWVGYNGITYTLDVFMADTSSLKNRAWLFAFSTCPYIANTFAGPAAANRFLEYSTFRWGFGAFAIITPIICAPVVIIFIINRRKAIEHGYVAKERSGRTLLQSILHYAIEFDLVGMILIVAAFALFLLPFSLASSSASEWKTGHIIAMIVVGGVLFPIFALWEKYFAKVCFAPFHLLVDRTVLCGCLLGGTLFLSFYCWDIYFQSYLQVVHGLDVSDAGYVYNIYNIGSCFWSVIVGAIVRATGNFKWVAFAAVPVQMLGTGLMIYFRQPGMGIGYVVMCQIFIAFSGGTLVICEEMAVMAAAAHSEVAVVLALLGLFTNIGGAVGQTIAGAIWTNTLPGLLEEYLPDNVKGQAFEIYGSLPKQLQYPMGSPEREAINRAYGDVQRRLVIASVCVLPLAFVFILMWRNINVKKVKQVRGNVV